IEKMNATKIVARDDTTAIWSQSQAIELRITGEVCKEPAGNKLPYLDRLLSCGNAHLPIWSDDQGTHPTVMAVELAPLATRGQIPDPQMRIAKKKFEPGP